jgi:hypothetical protein
VGEAVGFAESDRENWSKISPETLLSFFSFFFFLRLGRLETRFDLSVYHVG